LLRPFFTFKDDNNFNYTEYNAEKIPYYLNLFVIFDSLKFDSFFDNFFKRVFFVGFTFKTVSVHGGLTDNISFTTHDIIHNNGIANMCFFSFNEGNTGFTKTKEFYNFIKNHKNKQKIPTLTILYLFLHELNQNNTQCNIITEYSDKFLISLKRDLINPKQLLSILPRDLQVKIKELQDKKQNNNDSEIDSKIDSEINPWINNSNQQFRTYLEEYKKTLEISGGYSECKRKNKKMRTKKVIKNKRRITKSKKQQKKIKKL
jgi:hypothetical protein